MAKILIVDDDPDILFLLKRCLENAEFQVVSVSDPSRAVQVARESAVDAAVLDIMMPGVSGYEVLQGLRSQRSTQTLPVVFLSARDGDQDREHGLSLGANDYLAKPFQADQLVASLENLLREHLSIPGSREGDLAVYRVDGLLKGLQERRETGALVLVVTEQMVRIRMHCGQIVAASSGKITFPDAVLVALEMTSGRFHFQATPQESESDEPLGRKLLPLEKQLLLWAWLNTELVKRSHWLPPSDHLLYNGKGAAVAGEVPSELPVNSVRAYLSERPGTTRPQLAQALALAPIRVDLTLAWLAERALLSVSEP
ncbi:MAG: response regulator [Deltaproteobacteria bacterium]|nr:response regulator [Deltaproteobacteria bacterium]